jgi:fatty acid desaturase (delta-4 desaturase)
MAPDADKLRQRVPVASLNAKGDNDTVEESVASLKSLRSNEVVIEGVIYDITSFDHPGGESIRIFGGNDATVPYKMIHPYHTSKHLQKMKRVGVVPDFFCEYVAFEACCCCCCCWIPCTRI